MDADWEVEIGGGAPVIEALWPGFVDLRSHPDRVGEIAEVSTFPPLAGLLRALNSPESPVWTAKCDLWEPEPAALAAYIDMLPRDGTVFSEWRQAEVFCRECVGRLEATTLPERLGEHSIDLVIRQAIAGGAEGFGITAYLSAKGAVQKEAETALAAVMAGFADALPRRKPPEMPGEKLQ
jgi:hypothetical protein